ncbi:MAG: hypothetical protein P3A32_07670 [Gemmatimonadota bacterium]|nr:hypothetical protein [Gemmatimonadota bacterium]MDQ8147513.1 hypothetical protein [Gemmatimonadota bacterium]MDQ8149679.1 hypothetical protein [Gemmatimonadota bacterium]MDQ8157016.1 hypothetical protein [Gemmatimonadota bacterium]MDQ8176919.1 hypothetical protein [Gemmatimonadota bacterium]
MRAAHRVRPALATAVVLAATLVGCGTVGTEPRAVQALDFTAFPYPAVITGDSLRDEAGRVAPLQATAYDVDGLAIAGAPVRFLSPDTGVTIDTLGRLRTTRRPGLLRVYALVDGLQSAPRTLLVTAAPDTVLATTATTVTLAYAIPDVVGNASPELTVAVRSRTDTDAPNVTGWLVRWRAVHRGDTIALGDTTLAALQSTSGRRAGLDTTTSAGTSTRKLRIFANRLTTPLDSFTVLAEVRRGGVAVPGSPIRFLVRATPPAP